MRQTRAFEAATHHDRIDLLENKQAQWDEAAEAHMKLAYPVLVLRSPKEMPIAVNNAAQEWLDSVDASRNGMYRVIVANVSFLGPNARRCFEEIANAVASRCNDNPERTVGLFIGCTTGFHKD